MRTVAFPDDELRSASGTARVAADHFLLPLRDRTWRGSAGELAGSGTGSSLDFQDHRIYQPGDDPRHINWQAYARTGDYSMKLYREEVRPLVEIVFDVTGSMFFLPAKKARSLELFYFAVFAALRAGASATVFLVQGKHAVALEPAEVLAHHWTGLLASFPASSPAAAPNLAPLPFRPQSLRVLIGDLLHPGDPGGPVRELARSKGRAAVWAPFSDSEANPDWDGNYDLIDCESGGRHPHRIDPSTLTRYREAYTRHFELWKTEGLRHRIPVARIPCLGGLDTAFRDEAIALGAISL